MREGAKFLKRERKRVGTQDFGRGLGDGVSVWQDGNVLEMTGGMFSKQCECTECS